MTSGRNLRITATTSASTASFPQMRSVSSGFFENPKSRARVKNCSAPSMRRAGGLRGGMRKCGDQNGGEDGARAHVDDKTACDGGM